MKNQFFCLRILFIVACAMQVSVVLAQPKAAFTTNVVTGCSPLVVSFKDASTDNPTQWKWDLGNGTISTVQNPSAVYINGGTYTIKLVVKNARGIDSITKVSNLTVYANPVVGFTNTNAAGCIPVTTQFTDKSLAGSGTITDYIWDFGDGQLSTDKNPQHTYTITDTFSVSLTVRNSFGCRQTFIKNDLINVYEPVKAAFDYNYVNACKPPTPVNFINTSVSKNISSYQWQFGDGTSAVQANTSHTYTKAGSFDVQLIATTDMGCADTTTQTVTIGNVITDFSVPTDACTNKPISFTNSSSPAPVSATWSFGDGATASGINTKHTYNAAGTYTVNMTADFGSCNYTVTKSITVLDKPKAAFVIKGSGVCAVPATIDFKNNATGAVSYKWLFGDGTAATTQDATHVYSKPGFYTVSLIAYNANGCSDTLVQTNGVKLGPPRIVSLNNVSVTGCVPMNIKPVAIINSPENIVSYKWDFGDGTGATDSLPVHNYTAAGTYSVKLIVITKSGCSDTMIAQNAVVLGEPSDPVIVDNFPSSICASTPVNFSGTATGNVTTWTWSFGDGSTANQQNATHQFTDTGNFIVSLTVINEGCKSVTKSDRPIRVKAPIAKFAVTLNCADRLTRTFTDKSIDAKTWNWDFGDGTQSNLPNPVHKYVAPGKYGIKLLVTNGFCSDVYTDSIMVINERGNFSYNPVNTSFCRNDSTTFTAFGYNPANISYLSWNFGDGTTTGYGINNVTVGHKYTVAGQFSPYLIVRDKLGCRDTVTNNLQLNVYGPKANFTNVAGTCINGTITFNDVSSTDGTHPIANYKWFYGDGTSQQQTSGPFQHTYDTSGYFYVKLIVQDTYGCKDSLTRRSVTITNPFARFSASDSIRCANSTINFKDSSSGSYLKYNWSFGDGNISTVQSPVYDYASEGIYTVKLTVTDRFGCKDSMVKPAYITISNPKAAFTLNDTFSVCPPLLAQPLSSSRNYTSLQWLFGDGNSATIDSPTHLYTIAGNYQMQLIAKGYGACADTATKSIAIKGPSGSFQYQPLTNCNPLQVNFKAIAQNTSIYFWDYSDGNTNSSTAPSSSHTYTTAGRFLPKLVLIDSSGCKVGIVNTDTITVAQVKANMVVKPSVGCDSSLIVFADSSQSFNNKISNYQWNFGDNTSSSIKNPAHYFSTSKAYNISLKVISDLGCTDSITIPVNVTVNRSPVINFSAPDSVCINSTVNFQGSELINDTTNLAWSWLLGDGAVGQTQNIAHTYNKANKFTITAIATNNFGCADTTTHALNVINYPFVDAGNDTIICLNQPVALQPSGAVNYIWSTDNALSCNTCRTPLANPQTTTTFYVTGVDALGCTAQDSITIAVNTPSHVNINSRDTLCVNETTVLKASGAASYHWYPSLYLDDATAAETTFKPARDTTITYTLIGTDSKNCFYDTTAITLHVYPVPSLSITQPEVDLNVGSSVQLNANSSPDITQWRWSPATALSNATIANPIASPKETTTYTVVGANDGSCVARSTVRVNVLCNNANIFIPNTFSPNNDGMNDWFFPRGKGLFSIKSMRIFNRWGQLVFERSNFSPNDPSAGWDGKINGKPASADVYIFMIEVLCNNNTAIPVKGDITLIR